MCSTIIAACVIFSVAILYFVGIVIGLDILFGILLLLEVIRYIISTGLRPSVMKCRNCGSSNVKLSSVVDGHDYGSTMNHLFGMRFYSGRSKIRRKRIATCSDCGFTDEYVMPEDIAREKRESLGGIILFGIIFVILLIVTFNIFKDDNSEKKGDSQTYQTTGSVWSKTDTPLSDFKYYIDGNELFLKDYIGDSDAVKIASTYNVDGVDLQVVSLNETFTLNSRAKSVIIPEGVCHIEYNTFNSCDVEYIFFPAALKEVDGWNYFHDIKKIYYGGSEEEWRQLCTIDRADLGVQQVIYDASIADLQ